MKNVDQLRTKRSGVLSRPYRELLQELADGGEVVELFPSDKALAPNSLAVDMMCRTRPGEDEFAAAMFLDDAGVLR